ARESRGITRGAERVGRIYARAGTGARQLFLLVEHVRPDLDERRPGRRRRCLPERHADVHRDRRPVEDALRELGEGPTYLRAVGFLERPELVLGGRMLARETDDRTPGEPCDAEAGDGIREPAAGGDREHAGPAGRPRPRVGGIRARLLVAHVDHLDAALADVRPAP